MDERTTSVLSHGQIKAMKQRAKDAREERYLEQSRQRLDKIVCTKVRTAFIGALAAFEEEFGFLWGQDTSSNEKTEEQIDMAELWERARTKVLNTGNGQLRAVRTEIANHTINWNRHHLDFKIMPPKGDE